MSIRERLSGNEAVATAMKQINPDVVAAFPITPSTEIPQYFSSFVSNGQVDTEFVTVESEHSAMSACIGASAAGGRAMTATSSNGMSLMWEMLYIASGHRLPIVMALVNRTVSGPLNIHNDHSDSMGARDSGWIQLYSETNQEAYDNFLMANRIAEHESVRLPVMVCQDGFITSHAIENIELVEDDKVKAFVGEYKAPWGLLDANKPVSVGPLDLQAHHYEHKRQQAKAMENAKKDAEMYKNARVPNHLKNHPTGYNDGHGMYKYPHDFGGYVKQQYLPDNLVGKKYYKPGVNSTEDKFKTYLERLKNI
jgi:pyruvate ferredoxin oxidoreductase alpha subunit